jgi:hypothetical protein
MSRVVPSWFALRGLAGLATFAGLAGCTPTCGDVCDHMVACDNEGTERMSSADCEEQCQQQQKLYDDWTDGQKRDHFDDELSCLYGATCDELAEGVCYDSLIWSY